MSIAIQCPGCAAQYSLKDSKAGTQVECACGQVIVLPVLPAVAEIDLGCPSCSACYRVEAELAGQPVECECGQVVIVPSTSAAAVRPRSGSTATPPPLPSADSTEDRVSEVTDASESQGDGRAKLKSKARKTARKATPAEMKKKGSETADQSGRALVLKCAAVAAALAMVGGVYFVVRGDSDLERAESVVQNTQPAPAAEAVLSPVANPVPDPAPAPDKPARKTLAERLEAANSVGQSQGSDVVDDAGDSAKPVAEATAGPAGPNNPYAETGKKEFIALAPSTTAKPKAQLEGNPKPKPSPAKPPKGKQAAPKQPSNVATTKSSLPQRVSFVALKRQVRSFDSAAALALKQFSVLQSSKSKEATKGAATKGAGKNGAVSWSDQLAITGGFLQAVQNAVDSDSDPVQVARMRLLLAWCYLQNTQYYEAGILSADIARRTPKDMVIEPDKGKSTEKKKSKPPASLGASLVDSELGNSARAASAAGEVSAPDASNRIQPKKEAAMMALTAFLKAYEEASPTDRVPEYQSVIRVVDLIEVNWPQHPKANDLRLYAAQLSTQHQAPLQAVKWYLRVTKESSGYARARLAAGQIYYTEFRGTSEADAGELREKAIRFLQQGVELGADQPELKDNFYLAKLTLAQMELRAGNYQASIDIIVSGSSSLVAAVRLEDSAVRPESGIQSRRFAGAVFRTLVRGYVGNQQLEQAMTVVGQLDAVAGEDISPPDVELYLILISRLSVGLREASLAGAEDLELLTATAALLQKVVLHVEHAAPASLLKAALSATTIADVLVAEDAIVLHEIAIQIYEELLSKAPESSRRALRYRMAISMGPAGRYEEAFAVFEAMLREKPKVFDVQVEAARTLQAWGTAVDDRVKIAAALDGDSEAPHVWGWRKVARTLQRLMSKDNAKPEYEGRFLEARNAIAQCRLARSQSVDEPGQRKTELENAATEIQVLAMQMRASDNAAWQPLKESYAQIQTALGRPVTPLFESAEATGAGE